MRRLAFVAALVVVSALFLGRGAITHPLDDHPQDWYQDEQHPGVQFGLQQRLIDGSPLRVCNLGFPSSMAEAASRWNAALGFSALTTPSDCTYHEVLVTSFLYDILCYQGEGHEHDHETMHACTLPTQGVSGDPDYDIGPAYVGLNPRFFGGGKQWPDGHYHTNRDVTHEFGHVFGVADYSCPNGCYNSPCPGPTLMDIEEKCWRDTPQSLDLSNYHILYYPDPVTNLQGDSLAPGNVYLTWYASHIPNEDSFEVARWIGGDNWVFVKNEGKNATSSSFGDQDEGYQWYYVRPHTYAINNGAWGEAVMVLVYVQPSAPPPSPPSWMKSEFTSTTVNRLSWATVSGAHHYRVCTDFSPTASFTNCSDPLTPTYFNAQVPGPEYDGVQWYNKVKACDASDNCGALSPTFTLSERADFAGWNYAFTFYRDGSYIKFQFIDFISNIYGEFALRLHIKNGSSTSSSTRYTTPCIQYGEISDVQSYLVSSFSSGKLGTVGHTIKSATQCGASSDHSGDAPESRWGYIP